MSIKKTISILGAFIFLVFLIKGLYFDTNLGYTLEASPFSMTGCLFSIISTFRSSLKIGLT